MTRISGRLPSGSAIGGERIEESGHRPRKELAEMSGRHDATTNHTHGGPSDPTGSPPTQTLPRQRRTGTAWTALTVVEVVLAVTAVVYDLFLPAVVLAAMAGLSLAVPGSARAPWVSTACPFSAPW